MRIQERMASIKCAIKIPALKIIRKLRNQVLTFTSTVGSEPPRFCTVKNNPQGTAFSGATADLMPHPHGLSAEREEKQCADDSGREKWKPDIRHFRTPTDRVGLNANCYLNSSHFFHSPQFR